MRNLVVNPKQRRNMKQKTILIIKNSNGKPQYIQFDLNEATVTREYGLIGGVIQGTSHTYEGLDIGKSNERTPEQVAEEDFDRLIKTKIKEGYVITPNLDDLSGLNQERKMDLDNIPEEFCISKPIKTISRLAIDKLIKTGNAKFFVKYNGICHYILINSTGEVKLYTRRWGDHTSKYPEIVKDVKAADFPNNTLLLAEFCIDPTKRIPHMTAFQLMCKISKTDVVDGVCTEDISRSLELQKTHRVRAALFAILYCGGRETLGSPYTVTRNSLLIKAPDLSGGKAIFVPKEVAITSGVEAQEIVRTNKDKIEGFVLWDMTKNMEISMNGKPKRCASYKIKSAGDKDVIAYGFAKGRGRNQDRIGSLMIGQYDSEGNMVDLGTVGGLKEEHRDPDTWIFPCVIEIKYDQIFPDTGKFQFPRFSKVHEDKTISDVGIFGRS